MPFADKIGQLRASMSALDEFIPKEADLGTTSSLLTKKAGVLRHLSISEDREVRRRTLAKAGRCASLGVAKHRSPGSVLELALVTWAAGRAANNEKVYAESLQATESLLSDDILAGSEVAALTTVRFYRFTYQAPKACQAFMALLPSVRNTRRLLREAPVFAEAVASMALSGFPEDVVSPYLSSAIHLLERGLAAGYTMSRLVVALAYLHAIRDGETEGRTALTALYRDSSLEWNAVLSLASNASTRDFPAQAFALGIESSSVLTRLGTFAAKFGRDDSLAEALYRAAERVDKKDPVALTNLARLLIRKGAPEARSEAARLLQRAQNFADQRFHWWRDVLRTLHDRDTTVAHHVQRDEAPTRSESALTSIDSVLQLYREAAADEDHQRRGYLLEHILMALATLSGLKVVPSYRLVRPLVNKVHQLDGWFEHERNSYRCECKWRDDPVGYNDIVAFADKIDAAGVSALLVSINGFDDRALAKANELRGRIAFLFVDGNDLLHALEGRVSFSELMSIKRAYFDSRSKVYHPVTPVMESD